MHVSHKVAQNAKVFKPILVKKNKKTPPVLVSQSDTLAGMSPIF